MPPIAVPHDSELAVATAPSKSTAMTTCQVCLDDCAAPTSVVTSFCSNKCPAVLCGGCVAQHVRISVEAAFPGVLPKVRCPICLVPVAKRKWAALAQPEVLDAYRTACRVACSFQTPCCHDTSYTHLPVVVEALEPMPSKYIPVLPLKLVPSLQKRFPELRKLTRRFCNHKLSSGELLAFIADAFGLALDPETLDKQHLLVEHLLLRIHDEERRATLLLTYLAKHKIVKTRCCGSHVCFNCKRSVVEHTAPDGACDGDDALAADCIVECRACHVTMVKVEGCNSVRCWCGFSMDWAAEVQLADRHRRGLVPVDIFDVDLYARWSEARRNLLPVVQNELVPLRLALRLSRIDQQLPTVRAPLKAMAQHYIWRRRLRAMFPQLRASVLATWRAQLVATLKRSVRMREAVARAMWRVRWSRVASAIRANRFWINYHADHADELRERCEEERALLCIGLGPEEEPEQEEHVREEEEGDK